MHLSHIPDKAIVCWATDGVARGSFLGGTAMPAKRRFRHARLVVSGLVIATPLLIAGTAVHPAQAEVPYVAWSVYLPGWSDEYVPSSDNDCVAGRAACLKLSLIHI